MIWHEIPLVFISKAGKHCSHRCFLKTNRYRSHRFSEGIADIEIRNAGKKVVVETVGKSSIVIKELPVKKNPVTTLIRDFCR